MADDTQAPPSIDAPLDPQFFDVVNKFVQLANRQGGIHGSKRTSFAALYGVARYNAHVYLTVEPTPADSRQGFLDYMTGLYRRMLNEHLDILGAERGVDVGASELAAAYAAAQQAEQASRDSQPE
ncbi:DUF3144 domain-containing protein [Pseudoxanthomonas winnipegensis]|jgi:hypothetical protein|uniref:DUF3144 domain-containing protein n=1 Tax=Pseudoxanthomonas winnipegensis TaxID=2480810 RepID=A0ABY1WCA6_9GAMM|nr:DUF3144 domain-containing protein [Pseudoxanthomonas winnipegensis]TAA11200.1 DUF3144 domain-containing protein [Pseudoxanthomonas winnipegensis]TAA18625.1 DUF3144 domain-containing protein [Pseudoxanthomonas winnipegensis]TAH73999.1 DUF3144 domain-containing protein [Pseudoxanthomonas winnipegensis]